VHDWLIVIIWIRIYRIGEWTIKIRERCSGAWCVSSHNHGLMTVLFTLECQFGTGALNISLLYRLIYLAVDKLLYKWLLLSGRANYIIFIHSYKSSIEPRFTIKFCWRKNRSTFGLTYVLQYLTTKQNQRYKWYKSAAERSSIELWSNIGLRSNDDAI
jgi:hypothetical protein